MGTLNRRIAAALDDCTTLYTTLYVNVFFGRASGAYWRPGLRFTSIIVPKGATITSAYITFTALTAQATGNVANIYCEAADDPITFSNYTDYNNRVKTTAYVEYPVGAWVAGTTYDTPSLITPVQEVIDRVGWESGNALAFIITSTAGTNDAYSYSCHYEYDSTRAALLHLEWTRNLNTMNSILMF